MITGILIVLKVIGSLVLFLFGMQLMSESLQKVAGSRLRRTLYAMTSTRFRGILTGFSLTSVIQSSSATTVMLVSLVNAGLIQLVESVGVIMGANIGTTLTAWIISLIGLKIQIGALILPLIAITFPLIFTKRTKRGNWGKVILGFAILFIGLDFLKNSIPDLHANPEIFRFLSGYTELGAISVVIFFLLGMVMTGLVQSSSAVMAVTLVMSSNGWIPFNLSVAMVLGLNLGTTITANLAAMVANRPAKRSALIHFLFNFIGIIWVFPLFALIIRGLESLTVLFGLANPSTDPDSIPFALSLFHTIFNLLNTLLLVGFTHHLVRLSYWMLPKRAGEDEFHLRFFSTGMVATPELSIFQSKTQILSYAQDIKKMFSTLRYHLYDVNDESFLARAEEVDVMEENSDLTEREINRYLTLLSERDVSREGSRRIMAHLEIIDNIENIADCIYNLNRSFKRKKSQKIWFSPNLRENINRMFELVNSSLTIMVNNLEGHSEKVDIEAARAIEEQINEYRNELKQDHLNHLEDQTEYRHSAGFLYNDLFSESEKLADYAYNVSRALKMINA